MVCYRKLVGVGTILICIGALLVVAGPGDAPKPGVPGAGERGRASPVERLLSGDDREVKAARKDLLIGRKDLIAQLMRIIEQEEYRVKNHEAVRGALFVLGEMRAVEAVDLLVDHIWYPEEYKGKPLIISYHWERRYDALDALKRRFPAVVALIKIGEPSLDPVVAKLATIDRVTDRHPCVGVLLGLRDREYVIYMLEKAVEKEEDPKKRENLQRVIEHLTPKKKAGKAERPEP